ncbi:MAG: hypothetical protein KatS3mg031_1142 [Chitinophagales bacterium]|nr:MAG: hypothetical protein KatS3mg031_1142 [Chitinophagales bacterium]
MTRTHRCIAAVAFSLLVATTVPLSAQTVTRGPYLQVPTHNSIIIRWRTDQPTDSKVSYGTDLNNLSFTATDTTLTTEHYVQLTGLSPYTKYYYSVGSSSQVLSGPANDHYFVTSPLPGTVKPIRVWAIGDFGKANTRQNAVRDAYLNYTGSTHTDVWLWLGDNVYDNGTDQEYQDKVFDNAYYGQVFRYMPFWPCPGNHDYVSVSPPTATKDPASPSHTGPYYEIFEMPTAGEMGGVPSGRELYYSFDYGNVHFISLNSELGSPFNPSHDWTGARLTGSFTSSPLTEWLHQDLQANTQPWVIVYFHQPPYTKGSHDSDLFYERYMIAMRETFVPIFDQYGVDLVLCGHSHVYERSYLIKGHYGNSSSFDPGTMLVDGSSGIDSLGEAYVKDLTQPNGNEGTVYVVCGSSGSLETGAALNHPVMFTGYGDKGGSFILDIHGDTLHGRFLNESGEILDHFTMYKILPPDTTPTSTAGFAELVKGFQVYPNPFIGEVEVAFHLLQPAAVVIDLFDIRGRQIKTLYTHAHLHAGKHTLVFHKSDFPANGVFLLRMTTNGHEYIERLIKSY